MVDAIRDYFKRCPLLEDGLFHVNYLGTKSIEYTIDQSPVEPIVKRYADGGTIRQFSFVFASREPYGSDVLVNIEKSGFYTRLIDWIETQNEIGNLPAIPHSPQSIEILTQAYVFEATEDQARYQIQARLLYYQN